jgi:hypothetical protein
MLASQGLSTARQEELGKSHGLFQFDPLLGTCWDLGRTSPPSLEVVISKPWGHILRDGLYRDPVQKSRKRPTFLRREWMGYYAAVKMDTLQLRTRVRMTVGNLAFVQREKSNPTSVCGV